MFDRILNMYLYHREKSSRNDRYSDNGQYLILVNRLELNQNQIIKIASILTISITTSKLNLISVYNV